MNESTFERCSHDRQHPYVMIAREMAQDKTISPKAKGVLLYLLSLPSDWKIYHSQLQDGLGVGEDYINSAMDELLAQGYADRSREKVKGKFQAYKYKIRELKKCLPNRENQAGFSGPENPDLHKKHVSVSGAEPSTIKETTTKEREPAVVVSPNSESFELLKAQGFDDKTATSLAKFPKNRILRQIRHLAEAMDEGNIVNPLGWLRNAIESDWTPLESKPSLPQEISVEDQFRNRECARKFRNENWENHDVKINFDLNVEFVQMKSDKLYYKDSKFKELFEHNCRKHFNLT